MELHNQAEMLSYAVEQGLTKHKKELDKEEVNRVKADLNNLRRCIRKDKPDRMNEAEMQNLAAAKTALEQSAAHLMNLYMADQQTPDAEQ